ncbi:hypothetical protein ACO2Q2_11755 [Dyella sp. KRB-257]|uniref:hypothetical protein n=1 Tax=Dyella sp. KRB-257 TaxID=3400915 RepID=UPI003C0F1630
MAATIVARASGDAGEAMRETMGDLAGHASRRHCFAPPERASSIRPFAPAEPRRRLRG